MRYFQGIVVFLILVAALPAQNHASARFRFRKPIDRVAAKDEEIVAVALDSDVYAATRAGLPDLRILDETHAEAPYLIEPQVEYRQEQLRQTFNTDIVALKKDDNAIEVHLRLPAKSPDADGFSFATPLRNYERKVQVSGSADGTTWTPLVTDGIIFDYSQYMDVSSRQIALPKNSFREFKIAIADVTDEKESPFKELTRNLKDAKEDQRVERTVIERRPFRIDRIGYWNMATRERVRQAITVDYPLAGFDVKDDATKKQTIVTVRTRREPITRLTLETPSRNFSRRAVVETLTTTNHGPHKPGMRGLEGANPAWRPILDSTIENFSFRNQNREQLTIAIPEHREEQFRIVIHNEDNPPVNVTGVRATGGVQRLVFLAQPAKNYHVYYGSETAESPKYEAATVLTTLRKDNPPVAAKLGVQIENKEFAGEPSHFLRDVFNNRIFLGTAIVLMVAVLGWSIFRAGRRLENLPK